MWAWLSQFAAVQCSGPSFLDIPPWYEGLYEKPVGEPDSECSVQLNGLGDIWVIALNVLEIILRLSAYVAVGFVIFGSIMMIMSQGNPDRIGQARSTILNAVIGFVIAIAAASIVSFIAGSLD